MEIRDYRRVEPVDPIKRVQNEVKRPKENLYEEKEKTNDGTGKGQFIDYRV